MKNQQSSTKLNAALQLFVVHLIALIPPIPKGWLLRKKLYKIILGHLGESTYIQEGVEFKGGKNVFLGNHVVVLRDVGIEANGSATVEIGDRTFVNRNAWISAGASIKIGKDCLIAPYVGIVATNRGYADPTIPINLQAATSKGITIGDDCWLGHRVSVMDGVTIGRGCVIGAGAVVTKDIPPYSIAVGVPAKVVGSRKMGELRDFKSPMLEAV